MIGRACLLYTDDVALTPTTGWGVLHLFLRLAPDFDANALRKAVSAAEADGYQVVPVALLGHKADLGLMALGPDIWRLRRLQTEVVAAGLVAAESYVSLTEVSEYAAGVPEEMRQARLFPQLPPEGKDAFCFYPMSKRRGEQHNWYALDFDARKELMMGHGKVGPDIPRPGRPGHHRLDRARRLRVGRDPVRCPPRRLEGLRLRDALRRGVVPLRRVRALLHRHGGHARRRAVGPGRLSADAADRDCHDHDNRLAPPPSTTSATLRRLRRVVVAFSGGADSSLLAKVAQDTLGRDAVLCVTALSPSLAGAEEADCRALAGEWDLRWLGVPTSEMEDAAYVANGPDRCARCKTALMDALAPSPPPRAPRSCSA